MPRGKRTVFAMFCTETGDRIGTVRLHKQNSKGVSWKDLKLKKYSARAKKRVDVKLKEEKHSS
jgi:hypothetical protein